MGRTHENRDIMGLIVTNREHLGQETLPVVFVTAGVIARDWITVMAALNLIHELVQHHDDFSHLVDDVEWFILPCANPVRGTLTNFSMKIPSIFNFSYLGWLRILERSTCESCLD